jgi:putative SOS response-associated peptidase YedK
MTLTRSGSEIAEYFALATAESAVTDLDGTKLRARYNISPSQLIATIVMQADGARAFRWKKWGLVPSWSKSTTIGGRLFNARSETAHAKPSFRAAWKRRRCLVITDGFYEWTTRSRGHQPYHFHPLGSPLLSLAGLFEQWQGEGGEVIESCTVLTTEANADLEGIHHRMPVILEPTRFDVWLDPTSEVGLLQEMMHPAPSGTLEGRPVARLVNDARFDDPKCLLPESEYEQKTPSKQTDRQGELFRPDGERTE